MPADIDRFAVFSEKVKDVTIEEMEMTLPGHTTNVAVNTLEQIEIWHTVNGSTEATCVTLPIDVARRCLKKAVEEGIIDE